jgi:hypothetical protein
MELIMSPLGLMIAIKYLFLPKGLFECNVVFEDTKDSQACKDFYGVSRLFYKVGFKSHPP